jgi:WD40 repeat protein
MENDLPRGTVMEMWKCLTFVQETDWLVHDFTRLMSIRSFGRRMAGALFPEVRTERSGFGIPKIATSFCVCENHQILWSPDGRKIIAAGNNGEVSIWDATAGFRYATSDAIRYER